MNNRPVLRLPGATAAPIYTQASHHAPLVPRMDPSLMPPGPDIFPAPVQDPPAAQPPGPVREPPARAPPVTAGALHRAVRTQGLHGPR